MVQPRSLGIVSEEFMITKFLTTKLTEIQHERELIQAIVSQLNDIFIMYNNLL